MKFSNGQIEILSVFENDIIKYEAGYDDNIRVQTLQIPFGDIGEEKWSCENLVNNEKGFLYLTGSPIVTQNKSSINGHVFENVEKAIMEMNSEANDWTFHFRGIISCVYYDWIEIITTTNIKVETKRLANNELFRVTFPDSSTQELSIEVLGDECNRGLFKNFTITSSGINDKRLYSFYLDMNRDNTNVLTRLLDMNDFPNYVEDSVAILQNFTCYDYMALQNASFPKYVIIDIHNSFNRQLISLSQSNSVDITSDNLNSYISRKQDNEVIRTTIEISSNAIVAENDYIATFNDRNSHYWLCDTIHLEGGEAEKLTIYMEAGSSFRNGSSRSGTIYAKSGTFVNLNNASKFNVIYEEGADIFNQGRSVLIKRENIIFNYDKAPLTGCPDVEDIFKTQVKSFPFIPSNLTINNFDAECISTLSEDERFIDNGDGTLTDLEQSLIWKKIPENIPQTFFNKQNQAYNKARTLTFAGYDDWRLPTLDEIQTLNDFVYLSTTCISGYEPVYGVISGMSGLGITGQSLNECISGIAAIAEEGNIFDFSTYIEQYGTDVTAWTATAKNGDINTGSEDFYAYDMVSKKGELDEVNNSHSLGMLVRDSDHILKVVYDDGTSYALPTVSGETLSVEKQGKIQLKRNEGTFKYQNYRLMLTYDEVVTEKHNLPYTKHHNLNSTREYLLGEYIPLDRTSLNDEMLNTVVPIFLDETTNIPNSIFVDPEENIRICQHLTQKYGLVPFKVDYDNVTGGITVWVNMKGFNERIGVQYSLGNDHLMTPTYTDYETITAQLYSQDMYYCSYHFDSKIDIRKLLIQDVMIDITGEIILSGKTANNTYLREIKSINFFDKPKRFKTSELDVEIDVKELSDRESYINNYESIRGFVSTILQKWKPATTNIRTIVERNTLVMADLLKDEFTQVLVGITSRQNSNVYYVRSVDTGEVSIFSSSAKFSDEIDWIGVGKINTPYVKAGVTRIKKSAKNVKIPFDTRFSNTIYRVFAFSPNNSKYFVTQKDRDGFIVESSYFVEEEVAWIALNTNQIINGTIDWRKGVPETEVITDHLDRINEINNNSSKYTLDFNSLGFPTFDNTKYSVILSSDQNINLWSENKTPGKVDIRRSYAGIDSKIDFVVLETNTKWWKNITS